MIDAIFTVCFVVTAISMSLIAAAIAAHMVNEVWKDWRQL